MNNNTGNKYLKIDLTIRLPDVHSIRSLPDEYISYGRFAILRTGSLWFTNSAAASHPQNTLVGYYWALNSSKDTLFISPRGVKYKWHEMLSDEVLKSIIKKLCLNKYRKFKKII